MGSPSIWWRWAPLRCHSRSKKSVLPNCYGNYAIRRRGEPEDAAWMIAFLSSDLASWITGQTILSTVECRWPKRPRAQS